MGAQMAHTPLTGTDLVVEYLVARSYFTQGSPWVVVCGDAARGIDTARVAAVLREGGRPLTGIRAHAECRPPAGVEIDLPDGFLRIDSIQVRRDQGMVHAFFTRARAPSDWPETFSYSVRRIVPEFTLTFGTPGPVDQPNTLGIEPRP